MGAHVLLVGITALAIARALAALVRRPALGAVLRGRVIGGMTGCRGGAGVLFAPVLLSAGLSRGGLRRHDRDGRLCDAPRARRAYACERPVHARARCCRSGRVGRDPSARRRGALRGGLCRDDDHHGGNTASVVCVGSLPARSAEDSSRRTLRSAPPGLTSSGANLRSSKLDERSVHRPSRRRPRSGSVRRSITSGRSIG